MTTRVAPAYRQLMDDASDGQYPNNGFIPGVRETGGDMGGAVLTISSEIDYISDTAAAGECGGTGCQQVNLQQ